MMHNIKINNKHAETEIASVVPLSVTARALLQIKTKLFFVHCGYSPANGLCLKSILFNGILADTISLTLSGNSDSLFSLRLILSREGQTIKTEVSSFLPRSIVCKSVIEENVCSANIDCMLFSAKESHLSFSRDPIEDGIDEI